jgi:excisionase family DNA binding protein
MADYLTLEEAADRLGVEYKTIYRLVRGGEIPAGKIGRIYRVRAEDLDAYFEKQKERVATEAKRGLTALEGLRCGACGKAMVSELSVGGHCEDCGGEICQACWSIRKIRVCEEHSPEDEEESTGASPAAPAAGSAVSPCAAGSAASIAPAGVRPARETVEQTVARLRAEGRPVATAAEARLAEETFLRSFGQRLDEIDELPDPLSGLAIPLRDARVAHEIESPQRDDGRGPLNRASRFTLRTGGWGKPKGCLVLEARFLSRPETLREKGYDVEPIGEGELSAYLNSLISVAEGEEGFRVIVVVSPTGWTEDAAAVVARRHHAKAFRDRRVALALGDLAADRVVMDESDKRLWPFWPLVAPARYAAELARCVEEIREAVQRKNAVTLAGAVRSCRADASWVRAAFNELARGGEFTVYEAKDSGLVISRT